MAGWENDLQLVALTQGELTRLRRDAERLSYLDGLTLLEWRFLCELARKSNVRAAIDAAMGGD